MTINSHSWSIGSSSGANFTSLSPEIFNPSFYLILFLFLLFLLLLLLLYYYSIYYFNLSFFSSSMTINRHSWSTGSSSGANFTGLSPEIFNALFY